MNPLEDATPPLAVALVVRFLIELALLAGAGIAAWHLAPEFWAWPAAIVAPLVVAIVWGLFLSPRARYALREPVKIALETLLFVAVGCALFAVGLGVVAVIGVGIWAADRIAISVLTPRDGR